MGKYEKSKGAETVQTSSKYKHAVTKIVLAWVAVCEAWAVITGLWAIGFISVAFSIIMAALATCFGVFKTGYFWRDIKF